MTALKGGAIDRFLKAPPEECSAVLVYGPDLGLVRERVLSLAKSVTPDLRDPFNAIEFTETDLQDPTRLVDEAIALSFMGGRRSIRVRSNGDGVYAAAKLLVDGIEKGSLKPNALTVIEAGELPKTSKLRKLFDAARHAITLPCYEDKPQDLATLATEMAAAFHLSFEPEALDYAVSLLGTDRGISRSELEKLVLFAMPTDDSQHSKSISVNDVKECLVDAETSAFYEAAKSAIDGDAKGLSLSLRKSIAAGGSEVGFLRALQREVSRLLIVQTAVSSGLSSKDAMAQLRPPVFYGEQRAFSRRLQKWSRQKLAQANARLLAIEVDAKTTGAPSRTLIERASFAITSLANK